MKCVKSIVNLSDFEDAKKFVEVASSFEGTVIYGIGNSGVDAKCLDDVLYRGIGVDVEVFLLGDIDWDTEVSFILKMVDFL